MTNYKHEEGTEVTFFVKGVGSVVAREDSKVTITATQLIITDADVPVKNAQGFPDSTVTMTQTVDLTEIVGHVVVKKNLLVTQPGLIVTKRGQA